jgi:hypothetical protein
MGCSRELLIVYDAISLATKGNSPYVEMTLCTYPLPMGYLLM